MCSHCGIRPVWAKGLCSTHYQMVRIYGVPSTGWHDPEKIRERRIAFLWANIDKRGMDECWPWKRKLQPGGHGQLRWMSGKIGAHVAVYEVTYGEVPEDPGRPGRKLDVDHLCHDPAVCSLKTKCPHRACCNPAHLQAVPGAVNRRRGDTSRQGNGRPTPKCLPGCTCNRHISRKGGPGSVPCLPGCTCKRHAKRPNGGRLSSPSCEPGCTCGKHRSGGSPCAPDCTCGRHQASPCSSGCTCKRHTWRR